MSRSCAWLASQSTYAALCPPLSLQCELTTCQAPNCATCVTGSISSCSICSSGYTAVAGVCIKNDACIAGVNPTPDCAVCETAANTPISPDPRDCAQCDPPYALDANKQASTAAALGAMARAVGSQTALLAGSQALSCKRGGACAALEQTLTSAHTLLPPLQCKTCVAANCATCITGSTGDCDVCNAGYTAVLGECTPNNACLVGYLTSPKTDNCAKCQTAVNTPNEPEPNPIICAECTPPYTLNSNDQARRMVTAAGAMAAWQQAWLLQHDTWAWRAGRPANLALLFAHPCSVWSPARPATVQRARLDPPPCARSATAATPLWLASVSRTMPASRRRHTARGARRPPTRPSTLTRTCAFRAPATSSWMAPTR